MLLLRYGIIKVRLTLGLGYYVIVLAHSHPPSKVAVKRQYGNHWTS